LDGQDITISMMEIYQFEEMFLLTIYKNIIKFLIKI